MCKSSTIMSKVTNKAKKKRRWRQYHYQKRLDTTEGVELITTSMDEAVSSEGEISLQPSPPWTASRLLISLGAIQLANLGQ